MMKERTKTPRTIPPKITAGPEAIAQMFDLNVGSLANMRSKRTGPPFFKVGRKVIYRISDVESWITENPCLTADSRPCSCAGGYCHE